MKKLVILFVLLPFFVFADVEDSDPLDVDSNPQLSSDRLTHRARAERLANEVGTNQRNLAKKTDLAIANLMRLGIATLKRKGFQEDAAALEFQFYGKYQGFLEMMVVSQRNIGDHKPLSDWLAGVYEVLEAKLGLTLCRLLRLTDIKVFNFTIPVVFRPCSFDMDAVIIPRILEYQNHFAGDGKYSGLMPVVSYWVTWGVCTAATYGGGAFFICSPLGTAVEIVMEKWVAPPLSDKIFNFACN